MRSLRQQRSVRSSSLLTSHQEYIYKWSTCWTLAENPGHLKGWERPPNSLVGQKKEGERKRRSRMEAVALGGNWRWGESPALGDAPWPAERSARTEGELQALGREHSPRRVAVRTEWDLHRWSVPQFCVLHTQLGVLWCTWGLDAATWSVESRPAEGTALAVRGQPEEMGLRRSATRNACGGSMDRHRSKVPLLSDVQRVGSPPQSLLVHQQGRWGRESPFGTGWHELSSLLGRSSPTWWPTITIIASAPSRLRGSWAPITTASIFLAGWSTRSDYCLSLLPADSLCALANYRADSSGRNTHRGGLKPQLSPRSAVTKEELKFFLMALWTAEVQLCWQFLKLSACRTSKWTSVPAAETCLALAAVGIYAWGLGQARVWATSIAPIADQGAWVLQSWDLNTLDRSQRPGENNIWELLWPTADILTVKVGLRAVPTTSTLWACTVGKRGHKRAHSQENSFRRGILSDISPSGRAPILPTLHWTSETAKKQISN